MSIIPFDALQYTREMERAGFSRQQAEIQAEALGRQFGLQAENLERALDRRIVDFRRDLATKDDINGIRGEINGIRGEINGIREEINGIREEINDIRGKINGIHEEINDVRVDMEKFRVEIREMEIRLLKWQIGIAIALVAVMAKGFNWLGF